MEFTRPLPSDQQTLQGLKNHTNAAYAILYQFYYPAVERFILKNNGTTDQAKDIFQETMIILLEKLPHEDFQLRSSLKTYVFSISSNLWLKQLREAKKLFHLEIEAMEKEMKEFAQVQLSEEKENGISQIIHSIWEMITPKCQRLLKAIYFLKQGIEQVVGENKYTSVHNAQNQKYKCLQQARKGSRLAHKRRLQQA